MSKIIMLIAICILLITTATDGNAAPPTQPSVSTSMEKAGGSYVLMWSTYLYPSLPGGCVSIYSNTDQIMFYQQVVDANGDAVGARGQWVPGQFAFPPGPYYDPSLGWYDYCQATASYYVSPAPAHGASHSWIDLVPLWWNFWNFVFTDVVLAF